MDCMVAMREFPDKFFDLAIVDPPFGIGENWRKDSDSKFYNHRSSYKNDSTPGKEYFDELFRVSKDQIIWGCNYYWNFLPPSNNLIFWDKNRDVFTQFNSYGELAWTSIKKYPFNKIKITWNGCVRDEPRYGGHPHEKPVGIYRWLLMHYATAGSSILDTHLGSGSSRIAAHDMGFDFWGYELDTDYFKAQEKRFLQHTSQLTIKL